MSVESNGLRSRMSTNLMASRANIASRAVTEKLELKILL